MNKLLILLVIVCAATAATNWKKKCKDSKKACGKCDFSDSVEDGMSKKKCKQAVKATKGPNACSIYKANCKKNEDKQTEEKNCPANRALCRNVAAYCDAWAKAGECAKNPSWMQTQCSASCCPICTAVDPVTAAATSPVKEGKCPTKKQKQWCKNDSTDPTHQCAEWAKKGECKKNSKFMNTMCQRSCCEHCQFDDNKCPLIAAECKDNYRTKKGNAKKQKKDGLAACQEWAALGECARNPEFMNKECRKTCCPFCRQAAPLRQPVASFAPRVAAPVNTGYTFGGYGGLPFRG